jgi:hypothetical protein
MAHPDKDIDAAVRYAEANGWKLMAGGAHAWGKLYCPYNDKTCRGGQFCKAGVWSTPKDAGNHAKQLRRVVDNCTAHRKKAAAAAAAEKDDEDR